MTLSCDLHYNSHVTSGRRFVRFSHKSDLCHVYTTTIAQTWCVLQLVTSDRDRELNQISKLEV